MRTKLFGLVMLLYLPYLVDAQSWQLQTKIDRSSIYDITLDHMGNIYIVDDQGTTSKYTREGQLSIEYAPVQMARVYDIVANSQLKVLLFYKDLQEFTILDRYLSSPVTYRLEDFGLGYIEQVTPNLQPTIWGVDISDFSLKLIDLRENRLLEQKSLARVLNRQEANILSFHSYQNRMYLVDGHSGVQVFDNIGNYLTQLIDFAPNDIAFDKDFMYFVRDGFLIFVPLHEGNGKKLKLPQLKYSKIRYSGDRIIAVTDQGFEIYKYLSSQ